MSWNLVLFLLGLMLAAVALALAITQVNAFEQKLNQFIEKLNDRYDIDRLKRALEEEKRRIMERRSQRGM